MHDVVIKGARIVDGSGAPAYVADIVLTDGLIAEIGHVSGEARRTIDAKGLVVAPGFIDIHTHLDPQITWDPYVTPLIFHGVTSVIAGNCGLSVAPLKKDRREDFIKSLARTEDMDSSILKDAVPWSWETMGEYLAVLEKKGIGVNFGMLTGHNALRESVMGDDAVEREATPAEIEQMKEMLRQSILEGAFGFSSTVNPRHERTDGKSLPSVVAAPTEFWEIGEVLSELNRGLLQMSAALRARTPEHVKWLADKSRQLGRPIIGLTVRHFWQEADAWKVLLDQVEAEVRNGSRSFAQTSTRQFVHRFSLAKLNMEFNEFPTWHKLMLLPIEERIDAFKDQSIRPKLRYEIVEDPTPTSFPKRWDLIFVAETSLPANKKFEGKSIEQIANDSGRDIIDTFLDLSLSEDLETLFSVSTSQGDPVAVARIIDSSATIIGQSDAGAHAGVDCGSEYSTLLLGKWVREEGVMSLETAVRKMTSDQARLFEITNRGLLKTGYAADVIVFDPGTVAPEPARVVNDLPSGGARYVQDAIGMPYVIVNGEVVIDNGKLTSALPGQALRSMPVG